MRNKPCEPDELVPLKRSRKPKVNKQCQCLNLSRNHISVMNSFYKSNIPPRNEQSPRYDERLSVDTGRRSYRRSRPSSDFLGCWDPCHCVEHVFELPVPPIPSSLIPPSTLILLASPANQTERQDSIVGGHAGLIRVMSK